VIVDGSTDFCALYIDRRKDQNNILLIVLFYIPKKKKKKIKEVKNELEDLNKAKPLWMKKPD